MTTDQLQAKTAKDLAQMAKQQGVPGWHSMRKAELVEALSGLTKGRGKSVKPKAQTSAQRTTASRPHTPTESKSTPVKRTKLINRLKDDTDRQRNLAYRQVPGKPGGHNRDRLVVMVRDPYWMHAYWELTRAGIQRAEAALASEWHTARPVLRVFEVSEPSNNASETLIREIPIHGGTNNWYVNVSEPPKSYRLDIGYLATSGKFFMLARSNTVSTPRAGANETLDENWTDVAENAERIYAMSGGFASETTNQELKQLFEERVRRSMDSPLSRSLSLSVPGMQRPAFRFSLDAEMIIHGQTEPQARVTLQGDPVQLRPDGTFTVRFSLPDCRQIIPAVASSADGSEQRTIVVAVERNTKIMEPVTREADE